MVFNTSTSQLQFGFEEMDWCKGIERMGREGIQSSGTEGMDGSGGKVLGVRGQGSA
jgi:hypothetical protein